MRKDLPPFLSFHSQDAKPPLMLPLLLQGRQLKRKKPRELERGREMAITEETDSVLSNLD